MSALARLCALGILLAPALAHAGNGTHPRTPVKWDPRPACMTIVDRSVDPVLEFTYTIPYEDLRPPEAVDEVDDSRMHQFLGFCRAHSVQEALPVWLSEADVAAAAAKMLIDGPSLGPEDVFDTSTEWQGCFVRITADDQRRLITFAEAAKPVVWDTTGLPIGGYVIDGYTWEPPFNIFSVRPGVIKIVDDPDPAASPPALAISNQLGEEIVWQTEQLRLYGCVSAMAGSTLTGYWARTDTEGALDWHAFAEGTPVTGDEFELWFTPPDETAGELIAFRVDVTDPMDRTYVAHMDLLASVLMGGPGGSTGGCDGNGFIADPSCESTGGEGGSSSGDGPGSEGTASAGSDGPTEGSGGGSAEGTTGPTQTPPGSEGCAGCSTVGSGASLAWLVVLVGRRRRRRMA